MFCLSIVTLTVGTTIEDVLFVFDYPHLQGGSSQPTLQPQETQQGTKCNKVDWDFGKKSFSLIQEITLKLSPSSMPPKLVKM